MANLNTKGKEDQSGILDDPQNHGSSESLRGWGDTGDLKEGGFSHNKVGRRGATGNNDITYCL